MSTDDIRSACIDEIPIVNALADVFEIELVDFFFGNLV